VRGTYFLVIVAIAQLVFGVLLVVLLFYTRRRQRQLNARDMSLAQRVAEPLNHWMVNDGPPEPVVAALRALQPEQALEQLLMVSTLSIPFERQEQLALLLRREGWVRALLEHAQSRLWWRRLQAARLLSVVGVRADHALVRRLLDDGHPAVQTAATNCLERCADEALVERVVRDLHRQPNVVRLYQFDAVRRVWRLAEPVLARRLAGPSVPPDELEVIVNLVEAIGMPDLIRGAMHLRFHADPRVRVAVARTLKKYFHRDSYQAAVELLNDPDWRVRGQAARALGALGSEDAIPRLVGAMSDGSWWVRFRAGLSLAQLGERGRAELRRAREMSDRYGSDMARMISGLSDGGLVELSEA
jgi:HEAT repeat protein